MKNSFVRNCASFLLPAAMAIWAAPAHATTLSFDDLTFVCGSVSSSHPSCSNDFKDLKGAHGYTGVYTGTGLYQDGGNKLNGGSNVNTYDGVSFVGNGAQLQGSASGGLGGTSAPAPDGTPNYVRLQSFSINTASYTITTPGNAPFIFNSVYLWDPIPNRTETITLEGMGGQFGTTILYAPLTLTLTSTPTLFTFDWVNVTNVDLGQQFAGAVGSHGSLAPGVFGMTGDVNLDNLTVNVPVTSPVPEPSSLMLLGTGLLGIARIARKKVRC